MNEVSFTGYYDSGKNYGVKIMVSSVADVLTNTSTVTVKVYLLHPYMDISARTGSVTIDGTAYSFKVDAIKGSNKGLVATKSRTVTHNDDGSKEISVAASFPYDLNSSNFGRIKTAKVSAKVTLDDIPRSSEVQSMTEVISPDLSPAQWTLTVSKHAEAFRHTATLTFGDESIETGVFDQTVSAYIDSSWLEQIPNSAEGDATVSIQTYADETCEKAIGDPVVATFKVKVPDRAAPVFPSSAMTVSIYNDGSAAAGLNAFVQGYSKAKITFKDTSIRPMYGARIVSYHVEHDGKRIDRENCECITDVLTKAGGNSIAGVVTDSRGLSTKIAMSIYVQPYSVPTLSGLSIYRCNAVAIADEEGTSIYFMATAAYADCGGENSVTLTAAYKPVTQSLWTNDTAIVSGEASVLGSGAVSTSMSYNARIIAADKLGNKAIYNVTVSTAEAAFNIRDGGQGAAFGKYSEENDLLDCDWRFRARGGIYGMSIYDSTEAEHGMMGETRVYQRMLTGTVSANTPATVGTIENFKSLICAYGAAGNAALQNISVDSAGKVSVTAAATGTAYAIIVYTKEG